MPGVAKPRPPAHRAASRIRRPSLNKRRPRNRMPLRRMDLGSRRIVKITCSPASNYLRIFTALAATSASVIRDTADSTSINILARAVRGMVSVGENAVALVNDK